MSRPIGPSVPTIGRIVHVYLPPIMVPAIVTAVLSSDGTIACTAFPPGADPVPLNEIEQHVEFTTPQSRLTWRWPPVTR